MLAQTVTLVGSLLLIILSLACLSFIMVVPWCCHIDEEGIIMVTLHPKEVGTNARVFKLVSPMNPPHGRVFKQLELVQQEKHPLVVVVDRSCLYVPDAWSFGPESSAMTLSVSSEQAVGHQCPCCRKTSFNE